MQVDNVETDSTVADVRSQKQRSRQPVTWQNTLQSFLIIAIEPIAISCTLQLSFRMPALAGQHDRYRELNISCAFASLDRTGP